MVTKNLVGKRVKLISTTDEFTRLKPGEKGIVSLVIDDVVFVDWDEGSSLGLIQGEDVWVYE